MKFRIVTGALVSLFGIVAVVYGAAFVQGPLIFWRDPFEADRVQLYAMILGVAAMIIGAVTIASTRGKSTHSKI